MGLRIGVDRFVIDAHLSEWYTVGWGKAKGLNGQKEKKGKRGQIGRKRKFAKKEGMKSSVFKTASFLKTKIEAKSLLDRV